MQTALPAKRAYVTANLLCAQAAKSAQVRARQVFPSSTGIIGVPLPAREDQLATCGLCLRRPGSSAGHLRCFADAILTTDTRPKMASVPLRSGSAADHWYRQRLRHDPSRSWPRCWSICLTDVAATPGGTAILRCADACADTFNAISVDGDTSTNDTVLLLASGESRSSTEQTAKEISNALLEVCRSLAEQIVTDGEGVQRTHPVAAWRRPEPEGSLASGADHRHTPSGENRLGRRRPQLGRILAAVGKAALRLIPARLAS